MYRKKYIGKKFDKGKKTSNNNVAGGRKMVTEKEIDRFDKIFPLVRKAVGWSAEEFGDKIGVTRQTISNLENKRIHITKTTYIAMRFVLDEEIEDYPDETEMLKAVLDSFVDNPDKYTDEQREEQYKQACEYSHKLITGLIEKGTIEDKDYHKWGFVFTDKFKECYSIKESHQHLMDAIQSEQTLQQIAIGA